MSTPKQIFTSAESRQKLIEGIDTLADIVVSTLGPNGRNILIQDQENEYPSSTKDGVTVAKNVFLDENTPNMGAQMVKQASIKTAEKAGDGTTTSTLLARAMINQGIISLNEGVNAVEIKRSIDKATQKVIEVLRANSEDISSEDQLDQIATISANNDEEIGKLITSAIEKVGKDGVVHIEESKSGETYLETVEGIQFDRGYKSHFFVTDNESMLCHLQDAYILMADHKFSNAKDLIPLLEKISTSNKSLLIIAEDIDHEALATLIVNKSRGSLKVAAVKAPDFGDRRKLILEDIAVLTGGQVFSPEKGMKLNNFSFDWLGEARAITIGKEQTTIVDGKGNEEKINDRISHLQNQIEQPTTELTPYAKEQLQNRLAKMVGGVSVIHVGGNTETEIKVKKDRVDDALNATKAALQEGIVSGGGVALLYAASTRNNDYLNNNIDDIGTQIVHSACFSPFTQILYNAGYSEDNIKLIKDQLIDSNNIWDGLDLKTNKIVDCKSQGIIDPVKVTRTALENASSVAGTILLTEGTICTHPDAQPSQSDNMFGLNM
jgi:chaperonin GroEL